MEKDLLKQTILLFDTPNKWDSFIELYDMKEKIKEKWCIKLNTEITKLFTCEDTMKDWSYKNINCGYIDCRWYLTDFGEDSLCFVWEIKENGSFSLWNSERYDSKKIKELLETDKFKPLLTGFNRIDKIGENGYQLIEYGNFYFDHSSDGSIKYDHLSWFAGNKTKEFISQLSDKVNKFRKNNHFTALLKELNELTKK